MILEYRNKFPIKYNKSLPVLYLCVCFIAIFGSRYHEMLPKIVTSGWSHVDIQWCAKITIYYHDNVIMNIFTITIMTFVIIDHSQLSHSARFVTINTTKDSTLEHN